MSELENLDEYLLTQKSILEELSHIESKDFETKEKYIIRLKEVTRPLVEAGYYSGIKVIDLASFIQKNLLEKHNITYPDNGRYYSLFGDDEKHSKSEGSTLCRKIISPLPLEQQTGNDIIDDLKYTERNGQDLPTTEFTKYFQLIFDVSSEIVKQTESIAKKYGNAFAYESHFDRFFPDKGELEREIESSVGKKKKELQERYDVYNHCKTVIFDIENSIDNLFEKQRELLDIKAEQKHTSKLLDERNKITFIEKWNAIICSKLDGLGISAIAKRLGIDKKHMTNNIIPTHNPITVGGKQTENKHHNMISWFQAINIVTPSGETFTFNAKEYFDKQIERGKLNLPFKDLVLSNSRVL